MCESRLVNETRSRPQNRRDDPHGMHARHGDVASSERRACCEALKMAQRRCVSRHDMRSLIMAKNTDHKIRLVSSAGTGYFYTTTKNKKKTPDKLRLRKYDPVLRQHVEFVEAKIK